MIYTANLIKDNKIVNTLYNVISVKADKKYNYFEITVKLYKHEIVTIHPFRETDRVELFDQQTVFMDFFHNKRQPKKIIEQE